MVIIFHCKRVNIIMHYINLQADGQVNNQEFDAGWSHADFALLSDADMLFSDIDKNGDGIITGHSDMDQLFTTYDTNGKDTS